MTPDRIKIVYFGTPEYAVSGLRALSADPRYEVRLAVTQPDRPAGRGRGLHAPPVKAAAEALGIPVYQPEALKSAAARAPLAAIDADIFMVAAYGLIFGAKTLALPRHGCLNLHASLLPAYRGASPVTAAILAGDRVTGVSLMVMELGLDTGPVVDRIEVHIAPTDTTESLTVKLADAGAKLVADDLSAFVSGDLKAAPQNESGASKVRPLVKADGWLDWSDTAAELERRVRAMWPWPRAWTTFRGQPLQIHAASAVADRTLSEGAIDPSSDAVLVGTSGGALRLDLVQPAGGKPLQGTVWARGQRVTSGETLGDAGAPDRPSPLITEI